MKLIDPKMEEIPAICKEKIPISTDMLLCPVKEAKGGYTVQPVPIPVLVILEINKNKREGINNQNLKLFKRG
jgi:hypothetical protein